VISLGSRNEVVTLVMNPALDSAVPPAAKRAVDSVRTLLAEGKFAAPKAPTSKSPAAGATAAR
jgi:hypothetical protein